MLALLIFNVILLRIGEERRGKKRKGEESKGKECDKVIIDNNYSNKSTNDSHKADKKKQKSMRILSSIHYKLKALIFQKLIQ